MELMYLWVEKYKNIEKQGFNLSTKFKCEYNLDNNELKIEENENYVNLFPENINITAIVGKNGSGKSSVLELIFYIANKYEIIPGSPKVILLVKINNTLYLISNIFSLNKINLTNLNIKYQDNRLTDAVYLIKDRKISENINNFLKRLTTTHYFIYHIIEIYYYYAEILSVLSDKFRFNYFEFIAKSTEFNLKKEFSKLYIEESEIKLLDKLEKDFKKLEDKLFNFIENRIGITVKQFDSFEELLAYNLLVFYIRILLHLLNVDNLELANIFLSKINSFKTFEDIFNTNLNLNIKEINAEYSVYIEQQIEQYKISIDFLIKNRSNFVKNSNSKENHNIFIWSLPLKDFDKIKEIITHTTILTGLKNPEDNYYLMDAFEYDLIEKKDSCIKYSNLSDGEQIIIKNIVEILFFYLEKGIQFFLFDEPDNYLHPYWKRELLTILTKLSKEFYKRDKNFKPHFIITTHSPFLISDLPKQNIIFLDKDENGKCRVVDGLNEKKETFGANIHTLLSDSFFMENGLIGKFAESKIDEVIKYLDNQNSEIKDDETAQRIINIIGEPIIKKELQRKLDSKRLEKVDEIDEIKTEIELLKYRLEILRKNS